MTVNRTRRAFGPAAIGTALAVAIAFSLSGCGRGPGQGPATDGASASGSVEDAGKAVQAAAEVPVADDPRRGEQWGLTAVHADAAWAAATGAGVVIAVVDTGVDGTHPDLAGRLVPGIDLVDPASTGPVDLNGHGTHVAGIAAAATGNGIGVAGAAPRAMIMPVRVLDASGSGSDDVIASGIDWAVANGADVINLSLGESGFVARLSKNGPLNASIRAADAAGVVVVAAAGNDGARRQTYRVGVPVIVVNASTPQGTAASFSNAGDVRAVAAPGTGILSTAPLGPTTLWPQGSSGYELLDGTSMASPLVAGIAALLVEQGLTPQEVRDRLAQTATNPAADPSLGSGIVDAAAAVGVDPSTAVLPVPPAPAQPTGVSQPPSLARPPATALPAPPSVSVPLPDVATGTGGPGTVTVSLTQPVPFAGNVATTVSCATTARRYTAEAASASIGNGYSVAATVTVPGFRGPGDYTAALVVTITAGGATTPVPVTAPATIRDDLGGTTTFATAADAPVQLAGTLSWSCSV